MAKYLTCFLDTKSEESLLTYGKIDSSGECCSTINYLLSEICVPNETKDIT